MEPKMDRYSTSRKILPSFLSNGLAIAALVAALILLPATTAPTFAADQAPSAADQNCLGCHGAAGMEKKLADGDILQAAGAGRRCSSNPSTAPTAAPAATPTSTPPRIRPSKKDIKSARSYAVAATEACRGCHADKFEQWESSIHGALVRNGNPAAPICTDCHNPHAIIKDAATKIDRDSLQELPHGYFHRLSRQHAREIAASVRPTAMRRSARAATAAHDVKPTSLGEGPKAACFGCHAGVLGKPTKNGCPTPLCISRSCPARPATPPARSAKSI